MNFLFKSKRYIRIFMACISIICLGLASYVYYNENYSNMVSSSGYSKEGESCVLSSDYDIHWVDVHKEMEKQDIFDEQEIGESKEDKGSTEVETVSEISNKEVSNKKSEVTLLVLPSRGDIIHKEQTLSNGNTKDNQNDKNTDKVETQNPSSQSEQSKEEVKPAPEPTLPKEEPKLYPEPSPTPETKLMAIMGIKQATKSQMVNYMDKYSPKDRSYCENFVSITIEEAEAEGVRADVALCQMMKETSFLKFGGDVKEEQNNFAGIGAVGGGAQGASFPDIRTGIRAVIQHLKAYGSTAALNKACVDPRFKYVKRGSAIYVEWLGKQENPDGYGWATDKNYGIDIVNRVNSLKNY